MNKLTLVGFASRIALAAAGALVAAPIVPAFAQNTAVLFPKTPPTTPVASNGLTLVSLFAAGANGGKCSQVTAYTLSAATTVSLAFGVSSTTALTFSATAVVSLAGTALFSSSTLPVDNNGPYYILGANEIMFASVLSTAAATVNLHPFCGSF